MIQYALKCSDGHQFDSWFQSAAAFERLADAGHVRCSVCGTGKVQKDIMAPRLGTGPAEDGNPANPDRPLSQPATPAEQALAALRAHVEKNSHYVGADFAREARAIHEGDAPDRLIHGEARPDDARALLEDGVPVMPLPFRPTRKSN